MAGSFLRSLCAVSLLHAALFLRPARSNHYEYSDPRCPTGFANFGDSLTDTGNALNAFPFVADAENPPYGETFFGKPAKRFCDGRLVPDFFSLAFRYNLLDGYFAVTPFNYKHGINFAVAGAAASLVSTTVTPFSLTFQVAQFERFQNSAAATRAQRGCFNFKYDLPNEYDYPNWLYTIELGGNDILSQLQAGVSIPQINSIVIPAAVNNITAAIEVEQLPTFEFIPPAQILYAKLARNFLVFSVPAQGCSTIILTLFGSAGPLDSLGCVGIVNSLVKNFNSLLLQAIKQLRKTLPGASIAYFDYYNANVEILEHPELYDPCDDLSKQSKQRRLAIPNVFAKLNSRLLVGFKKQFTKTACCGAPGLGALNYNPAITCGHPHSNVCSNPSKYVNWDGVHFTESFYRTISWFALRGMFTDHGTNYTTICPIDFSKFGNNVSYELMYGLKCTSQLT